MFIRKLNISSFFMYKLNRCSCNLRRTWTIIRIPSVVHTHTRLTAFCPGLPRWAGTRKVKPIWILLEQETVSGSGISWAICKSAAHSTPALHYSSFLQAGCPSCCPTVSQHWRQTSPTVVNIFNLTNIIFHTEWLSQDDGNVVISYSWDLLTAF